MMSNGVRFNTASNHRRAGTSQRRGAYFVLQLHDELIYETTEEDLIQVWQLYLDLLLVCSSSKGRMREIFIYLLPLFSVRLLR